MSVSSPKKQVNTLLFTNVILDQGIDKPLAYSIPENLINIVKPGMRVEVPLMNQKRKATVLSISKRAAYPNCKPISKILSDKVILSPDLLYLADFIHNYYACSYRKVFKMMIPSVYRQETKEKKQLFLKLLPSKIEAKEMCISLREKHPKQAHVLDFMLQSPKGILLTELLEKTKTSLSPVESLIKKNILQKQTIQIDRSSLDHFEFFQTKDKTLNPEQKMALDSITNTLEKNTFAPHLIYGVTGSGKTEVYLQAIKKARSMNKSVLMLVPEISLTTQTIERFRSRFEEKMVILHHRLSDGEKIDAYHQILDGKISIVIGARSAIFTPLQNLGLIIVDEEHEGSFKQTDEMPTYNGRDLSVLRAKHLNATVILGSATPSMESFYLAKKGSYALHTLSKRASTATLPKVHVIDMKTEYEKNSGFTLFSSMLISKMHERIKKGEQVLLFLNRRGYHSTVTCKACAEVIKCPHCDVSLTFHRNDNHLSCHICQYALCPPPRNCKSCKAENELQFRGAGTEQIQRAIHALIPDVRTTRMDADTTRHKGSHEKLFKQFRSGKADVLIGTQMVAKGLHFPNVTLVGVLNADQSLHIPDYRSSEQVFQLLTQVSGRAGRGDIKGEVIIQTSMPDHPTIKLAASADYDAFYESEIASREMFSFPPYTHLIKLLFKGPIEKDIVEFAKLTYEGLLAKLPRDYTLYPPIAASLSKVKDNYRYKLLIKGNKVMPLTALLQSIETPKNIRLLIDVDPLYTL